jgi:hypothetical protein
LEYNRSHRLNQAILIADSQSPQKMGPGTGHTVQIGGGQVSNCRLSASISHFTASLGKISTWDDQIWILLKNMHLVIDNISILDPILHAPTTPPPYMVGSQWSLHK